ncbi:MAG: ATP-grasp domain-containing protein [Spirochaetaceae bacterium]|jgi:biotin carboxylase|nr:ATP-grasp domain-containing protein [Spirochaetaceae bacterium]
MKNKENSGLREGRGKQLIILGAGIMQGPAISIAKEMGLETVVADGDSGAMYAPLADRFEHIDLKDKEGVEALARDLKAGGRLAGIMTAGTDFSATVAWVAERLGLPGIPYETALNASDKGRMRRCFKEAGVPSPEFLTLDETPPGGFTFPFDFPAVVKPVDNMGGRGCRRVDSPGELASAFPGAAKFSRKGRVIVEEYMDGPEFSVDALVFHGEITICGLADRHIFFPPYFIEMGHTMPAALEEKEAASLLEVFTEGARALGLLDKNAAGAAKGDIKLSSRGPMIGEIAARLSGGYMSGWTYPYASGVEVTRGAIRAAIGLRPDRLGASRSWTCAERAFISIPGRVRSIHGLRDAKAAPYVKDLFLRAVEGGRVSFPENNVSKCGNVIASAPDRESAMDAADSAARSVLIRLEAPGKETDAFLAARPSPAGTAPGAEAAPWPPDAFSVGPSVISALARLPDPLPCEGQASPALAEPALVPFPAFAESGLKDSAGRGVEESLDAVRAVTGFSLPVKTLPRGAADNRLGRCFWAALIRGGYQGAAYIADLLYSNPGYGGGQR